MSTRKIACLVIGAIAMAYMTGCATTVPMASFTREIVPEARIASKDDAKVRIEVGPDVTIEASEKTRLAETIEQKIASFKILNNRNDEMKTYEVELLLTRYDKGNAFARAMLAGLGQIHIDGQVKLLEMPERKLVGEFSISKTFAWGGIYGAATKIEDIEMTFADGVASALTGQTEQNK
jgi:hypothetical protein